MDEGVVQAMPPVFEGVRVLDLTQGIAGAVAGMLLADHGADVIKVEPLKGDEVRSLDGWRVWHRGKRSIALDLEHEQGAEVIRRQLPSVDVMLESGVPGSMEDNGLGYAALAPLFTQLVYASVTGYGQQGKDRGRPGRGELVEARLGLQWEQAGYREGPIYLGWPLAEYGAALLLAIGTVAALYARTITGRGQHVDTSLKDGVAFLAGSRWAWAEHVPIGGKRIREPGIRHALGNTRHVVGVFQCQDGGWVHVHDAPRGGFNRMMRAFEMHHLVDPEKEAESQPSPLPKEVADQMWADVEAVIRTRPRDEWVRILSEADLPVMPAVPPGDGFDNEQLIANDLIVEVPDPEHGLLRQVGLPLRFARTPGSVVGPAPRLGQHTVEVLREAGYGPAEVEGLRRGRVVA